MMYGPTLVALWGEDTPPPDDLGFWAALAKVGLKVGKRVGKGIGKAVRAKRAAKRSRKLARAVSAVSSAVPVTVSSAKKPVRPGYKGNQNPAAGVSVRAGISPGLLLVGGGVVALLLLSRGGSR